jgi:glycosyltransferase involved in cell wall biosynthesis
MYDKPIGISILTNGNRLGQLQTCLGSLLTHSYTRNLVVGIFNNGSTDDTRKWLSARIQSNDNPWNYGITFRVNHSDKDLGCAAGTNAACELVRDCEFAIHVESDFEHLSPDESGEDRLWLRRAVEFMQEVNGNYMYLRRMTDEWEMLRHWWAPWMSQIEDHKGKYLSCPNFWWSNNPALRRNDALYERGTLPLDISKDGPKGTSGWSKPELETKAPGRAWIHQWGLFIHDRQSHTVKHPCGNCNTIMAGKGECKYGFFKNGEKGDKFCEVCLPEEGFRNMGNHKARFQHHVGIR